MSTVEKVKETIPCHLVTVGGAEMPIDCDLIFEANDPVALRMDLAAKGEFLRQWAFARDLLRDGLHCLECRPAGDFDVVCWTSEHTVHILLTSDSGQAELALDWMCVCTFLRQVYDLVPPLMCDAMITQKAAEFFGTEFEGATW